MIGQSLCVVTSRCCNNSTALLVLYKYNNHSCKVQNIEFKIMCPQFKGERKQMITCMYILISHNHYCVATVINYENNLHKVNLLFTSVKFSRALTTPRSLKLYKQVREHIITSSHCGSVSHTPSCCQCVLMLEE